MLQKSCMQLEVGRTDVPSGSKDIRSSVKHVTAKPLSNNRHDERTSIFVYLNFQATIVHYIFER